MENQLTTKGNMIKWSFKKLPVNEAGVAFDSLEAFKASELSKIHPGISGDLAAELVAQKDLVIEILEINENSLPAARGVKKTRKPKAPAVVEEGKAA